MVSFSGRHYPKFIILQCVRWYVAYALSYRNGSVAKCNTLKSN